jgi:hypothetical protein
MKSERATGAGRRVERVARGEREARSPWIELKRRGRALEVRKHRTPPARLQRAINFAFMIQARRGVTAAGTWLPSLRASGPRSPTKII